MPVFVLHGTRHSAPRYMSNKMINLKPNKINLLVSLGYILLFTLAYLFALWGIKES